MVKGEHTHERGARGSAMLNSLRKMFSPQPQATYHRRWPRILMSEPARVSFGRGDSKAAFLDEICVGGARVKISHRLAPGSMVSLDFKTGPVSHHSIHARVVHVLKEERGFNWHCGLCFVDVDPRESQRIAEYVEAERKRREVGFAMPRA